MAVPFRTNFAFLAFLCVPCDTNGSVNRIARNAKNTQGTQRLLMWMHPHLNTNPKAP
ncbi:MAG: hypothetical protein JWQ78_873 [Sediminibacterium sp.]|nr:hypothetical protein [Sediminibacterium sp.]